MASSHTTSMCYVMLLGVKFPAFFFINLNNTSQFSHCFIPAFAIWNTLTNCETSIKNVRMPFFSRNFLSAVLSTIFLCILLLSTSYIIIGVLPLEFWVYSLWAFQWVTFIDSYSNKKNNSCSLVTLL